jgi:hypothetical protein
LCSYQLHNNRPEDLVRSNLFCKYSFDLPLWLEPVQDQRWEGLAGLSPALSDPRIFVVRETWINKTLICLQVSNLM